MRNRFHLTFVVAAVCNVALWSGAAHAQTNDGKPKLGFSIAEKSSLDEDGGPLFKRVKAAFVVAEAGDDAMFASFMTSDAKLELTTLVEGKRERVPFTAETVRTAKQACLGPYAYYETETWVQMSWVCRDDAASPFKFDMSPELSLTVWFKGDAIQEVEAMEPLPMPLVRRVSKGAYAALKGSR